MQVWPSIWSRLGLDSWWPLIPKTNGPMRVVMTDVIANIDLGDYEWDRSVLDPPHHAGSSARGRAFRQGIIARVQLATWPIVGVVRVVSTLADCERRVFRHEVSGAP